MKNFFRFFKRKHVIRIDNDELATVITALLTIIDDLADFNRSETERIKKLVLKITTQTGADLAESRGFMKSMSR